MNLIFLKSGTQAFSSLFFSGYRRDPPLRQPAGDPQALDRGLPQPDEVRPARDGQLLQGVRGHQRRQGAQGRCFQAGRVPQGPRGLLHDRPHLQGQPHHGQVRVRRQSPETGRLREIVKLTTFLGYDQGLEEIAS